MLTVRNAQLEAFSKTRRAQFISEMLAYMRSNFSEQTASLRDAELRERIDAAVTRADKLKLEKRSDVCRYLNLCVALGWEFDEQPEHQRVRDFLTDPEVSNPSDRVEAATRYVLRQLEIEEHNRGVRQQFEAWRQQQQPS